MRPLDALEIEILPLYPALWDEYSFALVLGACNAR